MTKKIHTIKSENKHAESLQILKSLDSSEKFGHTEKYCSAAIPDSDAKKRTWEYLFSAEAEKASLYDL
jgi:hypothetical protein